tara:strand:+ start:164 stop:721 length:558 start_codon:yes stop_codon:yes gene_type:complete
MNYTNNIQECCAKIEEGGVVIYPTDTVLGLGCDATNKNAIRKLIKIKKREQSKGLIILVDSINMLSEYVEKIPEAAIEKINKTNHPTTIIYQNPINLPSLLYNNNSIAIRITKNKYCKKIIYKLKKPIVSTSANISGKPIPINFTDLDNELKNKVDCILKEKNTNMSNNPSKIYKIEGNTLILIR